MCAKFFVLVRRVGAVLVSVAQLVKRMTHVFAPETQLVAHRIRLVTSVFAIFRAITNQCWIDTLRLDSTTKHLKLVTISIESTVCKIKLYHITAVYKRLYVLTAICGIQDIIKRYKGVVICRHQVHGIFRRNFDI